MKSQLMTLQQRLGEQAAHEADLEAKSRRGGFNRTGAMMPSEKSVYFDDYARKNQPSPTRRQFAQSYAEGVSTNKPQTVGSSSGFSRPTQGGACEWDRLMKEREELLQSGVYTNDDPLIKEIDRQIQASQISAS